MYCILQKGIVEPSEDDTWYYLLMFTLALCNIRCTSFCLEKCWSKAQTGNIELINYYLTEQKTSAGHIRAGGKTVVF